MSVPEGAGAFVVALAAVVLAAACDQATGEGGPSPRPPLECSERSDCPLGAVCAEGRCFSNGAACASDRSCGAQYRCSAGVCVPVDDCAATIRRECCDDSECPEYRQCEGFACVGPPCRGEDDCNIAVGLVAEPCFEIEDCGARASGCVDFGGVGFCALLDGTCCDTGGPCAIFPAAAPDGSAAAVCNYTAAQCVAGRCQFPANAPSGGLIR